MRKTILALFGLLIIVLPQLAGANDFRASNQYPAKFLCGYTPGEDARLGVVQGHYNTIINILALKDNTAIAVRATMVSTDLEISEGEPSDFSEQVNLDQDEAIGILCADIKRDLFDSGGQGFMDGFVMIYSSKPLNVTAVVTGENEGGHSMQITPVAERRANTRISPRDNPV